MKTTILLSKLFTVFAFAAFAFAPVAMKAQSKIETSVVKDGYVMLDGQMMEVTAGKMMPMQKNVALENGVRIKKNGVIKIKGQKRIKMMNGNCADKTGVVSDCNVNKTYFTCVNHPEVHAAKDGKCPKCGMDLVQKN